MKPIKTNYLEILTFDNDCIDLIKLYIKELNLPFEVELRSFEMFYYFKRENKFINKTKRILCSSIVYISSMLSGIRINQRKIALVANISEAQLIKTYKQMINYGDK